MSEYRPPILTIDGIIFQLIDGQLCVLLLQRQNIPFKGQWALPGGYNPEGETTMQALTRVLRVKTGIDTKRLGLIEQLYTFDSVGRDPRGHAVSVSYMGLCYGLSPLGGKTTENPQFFPVSNLPKLAYDHPDIIKYAHERLRSKLAYTNAVFALLPSQFTFPQLQSAYEAVLGHELDKRNFRKRFTELDLIVPTGEFLREGAHRPAKLYCFKHQSLQSLPRNFD
ncbi:MAG TPA: NUDIX domain-containing protein [Candidatus Binatia bacterium]|nr:NUDIX domain-containing protein [Candidatus Binatia bacterium]